MFRDAPARARRQLLVIWRRYACVLLISFAMTGSPDTKPWLDLLKLFAFGTWAEFIANSANLPKLDDAQALKLKQLTVVSLAADAKVIPYDTLLTALELKDTRTLEDCIIEGMY